MATKEDFEKERRQTLMSCIATGNWDALIVTHSGFERVPLSQATQEVFFTEQITSLENAILSDDRVVGRFAGFELLAAPMGNGKAQLYLKGSARHTITVQQTAHGKTRSLEHLVQNLEDTVNQSQEHLVQSRKRLTDFGEQVDQPFEYAPRLAELAAKQQELVEKLDLNRNAAPIPEKDVEKVSNEATPPSFTQQSQSTDGRVPTRIGKKAA